ncbi:MAG: bifunctional 4-hydroxy-3-methylbut-2-enyl diphosphate reductase/30S ribosomal protein S1 [Ruminiclostridium sp.]
MNKIVVAKTAGFCFGVKRAVSIAEKLAENGGGCTLGPIIHNRDVTEKLEKMGVVTVNSPEEAKGTLIIRSHGVGKDVYSRLSELGIDYIDATCPFVEKIHKIVAEQSAKGAEVLIAGDNSHPEVQGIIGHCSTAAVAVNSMEQLQELVNSQKNFGQNALIFVAQTTFDMVKWTEFKNFVKKHYTKVQIFDTICSATTNRQTETASLAKNSHIMVVVGGRHSSNSRKLADICRAHCRTYFVENAAELDTAEIAADIESFSGDVEIGITAGASTPADIIKEVHRIMSEIKNDDMDIDFMAEVDKTFKRVYIGNRVKAYVVSVNNTEAVVDIGTKHSGYIPADELSANPNLAPKDVVKVGDEIECIVTSINDAEGVVYLSKKRVDAAAGLEKLVEANQNNTTLEGVVTAVVKGGVIVTCEGSRVFVPASHTGIPRPRKDEAETPEELAKKLETLLKKTVSLKIIEVNEARGRVVGSIKNAVKEATDAAKAKFWESIEVGQKFKGQVKSMESYGVFVDLGGVDGMVHTSELTWNRIKHPKEVVSIGDELEVYVKSFDPEKKRVSLGAKNPDDNPWTKFLKDFAVGDVVKAQIVSITPFGAFAQIIPGVDGLIHISQVALEKVVDISKYLSVGQTVEAKITEIDEEKARVSLSIKALLEEAPAEEEAAEEASADAE